MAERSAQGWLADDARLRVALTGGIGSGKSTVASAFERRGVAVIDADRIAHELTAPGSPALAAIAARFGADLVDAHGELDRRALRARVFSDGAARAALEALLHPAILDGMAARGRASSGDYLMFVVPLLVERGLGALFDRVLVVDCPVERQVERVVARDGESPAKLRDLLGAQVDRAARNAAADDLIENDDGLEALDAAVGRLHEAYITLSRRAPFPRSGGEGQNSAP
jgi:dephospho-CoA kinase